MIYTGIGNCNITCCGPRRCNRFFMTFNVFNVFFCVDIYVSKSFKISVSFFGRKRFQVAFCVEENSYSMLNIL